MPAELFDIYFSKSSSDSASQQGRLLGFTLMQRGLCPSPVALHCSFFLGFCEDPCLLESVLTLAPSQTSLSQPALTYSCFPEFSLQFSFLFTFWMLPLIQIHSFNYMHKLVRVSIFLSARPRCVFVYWASPGWKAPGSLLNLSLLLSSQPPCLAVFLPILQARNRKILAFSLSPSSVSLPNSKPSILTLNLS